MAWIALDVGGANLKAADGCGYTESRYFALWRNPDGLAEALRQLLRGAPPHKHVAVTMTGELADCFRTKAEGIRFILDAVASAVGGTFVVYLTDGRLVPPDVARRSPLLAAASNWHALASFAGRQTESKRAILADLGSTTFDCIPIEDGTPSAQGATDPERLLHGELVYTGMKRSPICALVRELPWHGRPCPVAQELFATTWDAYLILEKLPEQADSLGTADGGPATRDAARDRLARCICADREMFSAEDALCASGVIAEAQLALVRKALARVAGRWSSAPDCLIACGEGEFVIERALDQLGWRCERLSLARHLGPSVSQCAPAHALAVLARRQSGTPDDGLAFR